MAFKRHVSSIALAFSVLIGIRVTLLNPDSLLQLWSDASPQAPKHVMSSVTELITRQGYPFEEYEVVTLDGFVLPIQRIPNPGGPPVMLQHGLLDSSISWVVNPRSLAFMLHDQGYDVWLSNTRGAAEKHAHLNKQDVDYFQWSFDEIAEYDFPALVNLTLSVNGGSSLSLLSHSQGSMATFAALSNTRSSAWLKEKINFIAVMGSPGNFHSEETLLPLPKPLVFADALDHVCAAWLGRETCLDYSFFNWVREVLFIPNTSWLCGVQEGCDDILAFLAGGDPANFRAQAMIDVFDHYPKDSSYRNLHHFAQMESTGKFRKFDHGKEANLARYATETPPAYTVAVQVPTAVYYGTLDTFVSPQRSRRLVEEVRASGFLVDSAEIETYGHADFVWGLNVPELVYDRLINNLHLVAPAAPLRRLQ